MAIGSRIRYFGVAVFGRIKTFAEAMDMAPPNLHKYMNDEREPGIGILQKMQSLGCSIDWLLSGEGEMLLAKRSRKRKQSEPETADEQQISTGDEVRVVGSMKDLPNISLEKVSLSKLKKVQSGLKESDDGH